MFTLCQRVRAVFLEVPTARDFQLFEFRDCQQLGLGEPTSSKVLVEGVCESSDCCFGFLLGQPAKFEVLQSCASPGDRSHCKGSCGLRPVSQGWVLTETYGKPFCSCLMFCVLSRTLGGTLNRAMCR